jgi:signal transduction histidine kinase
VRADPAVEVALHRIAGEALANAARHSGARHVALSVRDARGITLEVSDDGTGLDARTGTSGSGLGLASMQRRAEEVGGSFQVLSSARGTTVSAVLPHSVGDL